MINSEVFIIKRDGKKETFSLDKIKNAIAKAFLSVGSFATQDVITTVLSRVSVSDGMNVEEIQNQVEVALMAEHYYSVAKAYMLYRQKHLGLSGNFWLVSFKISYLCLPLFYETRTTPSCHPSGCAYRQL